MGLFSCCLNKHINRANMLPQATDVVTDLLHWTFFFRVIEHLFEHSQMTQLPCIAAFPNNVDMISFTKQFTETPEPYISFDHRPSL